MLSRILVILFVVSLGGHLQAAFVFESQQRELNLVAIAGSTQMQLNGTAKDFSPLILDTSVKATSLASQASVFGRHISDLQPGSIFYAYNPSLLAGSGTGSPVEEIFASYHTLLNIVFSVTDGPLDLNIDKHVLGGTFNIVDMATGQSVADMNSPSLVTLQQGRYCLRSEFGISRASTSDQPFSMDFEGLSSISITFNAATVFLPEPSTLFIFSLLGGIGIFFGWRKRRFS